MLVLLIIVVLIARYYRADTMAQLEQITKLNKQIAFVKQIVDTQHYYAQQQALQHAPYNVPQHIPQHVPQHAPSYVPQITHQPITRADALEYNDDNLLSMDYHDDLNNYYVY